MRKWTYTLALAIPLVTCAIARGGSPKLAIHIEEYTPRACHSNLPELSREGINTTYDGVGRINAFVILYDYDELKGAVFALRWPETWKDVMWQDCAQLSVGGIHHPGDTINLIFEDCSSGGKPAVAGWLTATVTTPGHVEAIPAESEGGMAIVDCDNAAPREYEIMFNFRGGAGGARGADPAGPEAMAGRNWFVRPDSTGDAPTIAAAIKRASPGDTVFVSQGLYQEAIVLRNGVTILGSYNADFSARDLMSHPSVITTRGKGTCVVGSFSEDSTCVLDGFVIAEGKGRYGGGIALRGASSPTLRNLILYRNSAQSGGALFCHAATPLVENVLITGSDANVGAGIACAMGASPRVVNTTIVANKGTDGVAVFARGGAPSLEKCIVAYNSGGPALTCEDKSSRITFACCDLWGNEPSDFGRHADAGMGLRDNIFVDPRFSDVEKSDFTLSADSPCLDAANCGRMGSKWTGVPQ